MKAILTLFLILQFTTAMSTEGESMKHNLFKEIQLTEKALTVKVLSNPSFKLVGLGFKKGQVLDKHTTPTPAILIVQDGSVDFKISGKTYSLEAGDFFEIPASTEHEVVAKKDSHLYLIKK